MKVKTLYIMLCSIIMSRNVFSDQLDIEICKTILDSGIRSTYSVYTDQEKYERYKERICHVDFEKYDSYSSTLKARGLSLEISDAILGLSGSRDDKRLSFQQKYSQFCQSEFGQSEYRTRFSSRISRIETALSSSFNRCIKNYLDVYLATERQGIYIYVTPQRDFATFNVRVERNKKIVPDDVVISNLVPDEEVSCTRNSKSIKAGESINLNRFSMTCRKDPEAAIAFAIETQGEGVSNEVYLPERKDTIHQLEVKIEELAAQLIDSSPLGRVIAFAKKDCPNGWKEYAPAYGRFVRGIDRSRTNTDPDGERLHGRLQDYATATPRTNFTGRTTSNGAHSHDRTSADTFKSSYGGNVNERPQPKNSADGGHQHNIIIDGGGDSETRPKNVALLYCIKQ